MREIKLSLEMATKWYVGIVPELKALALQTYPELAEKELPKTWDELGRVEGCYVDINSKIINDSGATNKRNRNFFATEEQAEASIAMAQLSQLMAVYNDGWKPDWTDGTIKNCICKFCNGFKLEKRTFFGSFLNFKNEETAELFLENFSSLIQTAKPLL